MELDLLERKILIFGIPIFFLIFFFFPSSFGMKILYSLSLIFFLILFSLCTYWTAEWHPEKKFIVGFLVSFFHTFVFFLAGIFGLVLAAFVSKIFPYLVNYLIEMFKF
jgi:hypothetical protein